MLCSVGTTILSELFAGSNRRLDAISPLFFVYCGAVFERYLAGFRAGEPPDYRRERADQVRKHLADLTHNLTHTGKYPVQSAGNRASDLMQNGLKTPEKP